MSGRTETQPVLESGVLVYPNGEKYDGQYLTLRGKSIARSGHGKYIYNDGTVFEGDWENDKLKGHGTVQFSDGSSYKGEMRDLKFHGQGTYTFPNGTSVSGKFKKSRLQGDMSYTDEKGECWLGSAAANKAMGMQLQL